MIKLKKKTKLNKRQAPEETQEIEEENKKPTHEEARNAFEREKQQATVLNLSKSGDVTINHNSNDKGSKRNYSDSNSLCERESRRHKREHDNLMPLSSLFDPEIGSSSTDEAESETLDFDVEASAGT